MTTLVAGPTNAGKSTLISRHGLGPVTYAYQLKGSEVPGHGVLHYNLLHHASAFKAAASELTYSDLAKEPLLAKILKSGRIDSAIVVVAPLDELRSRAAVREVIEPTLESPGRYRRDFWSRILASVDMYALYERFFDVLDQYGIPSKVLYSSAATSDFLPSDRVHAHHNLRGSYQPVPSRNEIEAVLCMRGIGYQAVELPGGAVTARRGFAHLGASRADTFEYVRDRSIEGRSVLDIGCAIGEMLFRAERHGAGRLLGLEPNPDRFRAAQAIGKLLRSRTEFLSLDLAAAPIDQKFDDVLALNVLHHVRDIRSFIAKSIELTGQRLFLEYPTLEDPKFQSLSAPFDTAALAGLPLVGVSSSNVDQTFVFTGAAIARLVRDYGSFEVQIRPSPIPHREIAICIRKAAERK